MEHMIPWPDGQRREPVHSDPDVRPATCVLASVTFAIVLSFAVGEVLGGH